MKNSIINSANKVFERAIHGIDALKTVVKQDAFVNAVESIYEAKGKVIVSGMGKSGIVAKKISATLSSTGTSSLFLHPAEASHGDLGMIDKDDIVIMLSNSGETTELRDLILYTKRYHIKSISIVSVASSTVAKSTDIAIVLPKFSEAVDFNAPTTSTTMMMALGDAIAVSLIEIRGFNEEDFKIFHPGGRLGASFVRVKDIMHIDIELPFCAEDLSFKSVAGVITDKKLGVAIVVNGDGELLGIVTDGDIRRAVLKPTDDLIARDIMNPYPRSIFINKLAVEALDIMNNLKITSLVTVDESNKPVGLIHIHDCLRAGVSPVGK